MTLYMIIYVNNYDVGIEALPTPTITTTTTTTTTIQHE